MEMIARLPSGSNAVCSYRAQRPRLRGSLTSAQLEVPSGKSPQYDGRVKYVDRGS